MKIIQRIISGILAFCLVLPMLPTNGWAEIIAEETAIEKEAAAVLVEDTALLEETSGEKLSTEETILPTAVGSQETALLENMIAAVEMEQEQPKDTVATEPEETVMLVEQILDSDSGVESEEKTMIDSGTCGENLTWTLDSEGTLTISGTGPMADYEWAKAPWFWNASDIINIVIEDGVTTIGTHSLCYLHRVEHVSLPSSVISIGDSAFRGGGYIDSSLASIEIPDSVTSIGERAFEKCVALESITIPGSVKSIGTGAFLGCTNLSDITLENGIETLGASVFLLCDKLEKLSIPASVSSIGTSFTTGCTSLKEFQVNSQNAHFTSVDGVLFNKDMSTIIRYPEAKKGDYIIPTGVTRIGVCSFESCVYLTGITIPNTVQVIDGSAFDGCISLTSVHIPASVIIISSSFTNCDNLKEFSVDKNSYYFHSENGVIFKYNWDYSTGKRDGRTLVCYPPGRELPTYTVPNDVKCLDSWAFNGSKCLKAVIIPKSVETIWGPFSGCDNLTEVKFCGNPPTFSANSFYDYNNTNVAITAFYPLGNPAWTEDVMQDYGGNVTWVPYVPEEDSPEGDETEPDIPEEITDYHDTLEELTDEDYLAFAAIAYQPFGDSGTVKENLSKIWKESWNESQKITYGELCKYIANWSVLRVENNGNGFYAVAFHNGQGDAVIAYRGSVPPGQITEDIGDSLFDWAVNDLPMILLNAELPGNQFDEAIKMYDKVAGDSEVSEIAVTGHSLGGLWGDVASAYSGCKGRTFNAISGLDLIYANHANEMGKEYEGADIWNFYDTVNIGDIIAGMTEAYTEITWFGTKLKPFIERYSNYKDSAVFKHHGLESMTVKDDNGEVALNEEAGSWRASSGISNHLSWTNTSVDMGISGYDLFNKGLSSAVSRTSYGGNGNDTIITSLWADTLIGGNGDDNLDGGWGNDTYYYFKGNGHDYISDPGGLDKLILKGFSDSDNIEVSEEEKAEYIDILCNGKTIVSIYKKGREYSNFNVNSFKVYIDAGEKNDITDYFSTRRYGSRLLVKCPVSVEILDAKGNVVYTLNDGEVGQYYTDYGNFYVYEEEAGGYGKVLDLIEGYTARVVGNDTGTMEIESREVVEGSLAAPKAFVDVPVSAEFTAVIEETDEGELILAADTDGDSIVDAKIGYDGKVIPVEEITISEEYVLLKKGERVQLTAQVQPTKLTEFLVWKVEEGCEEIVDVDSDGTVTGLSAGTAYVIASVSDSEKTLTVRCRIDVTEDLTLDGVQLNTTQATSELYSTDYAELEILLQLPQNYGSLMNLRSGNGIAIQEAWFADEQTAAVFDLVAADDRHLRIVPKAEAVGDPGSVKGSYESAITVKVGEKEYTTESLKLTVKKSLPKLKAAVDSFNSFYSGESREIQITGATVKEIRLNGALPDWLALEEGFLVLTEAAPLKSGNAKVSLLVDTEEWCVPAVLTLNVKNVYKAPGLKLSASSVSLSGDVQNSVGVPLMLQCKNKKDVLAEMKVTRITAPEGYSVSDFDPETGRFILKAEEGFKAGSIQLNVHFSDTDNTLPLKLTVKSTKISLKLAKTSVTLNAGIPDSISVPVTVTPGDYRIGDYTMELLDKSQEGQIAYGYEKGCITVATTDTTEIGATYKLRFTAAGKSVNLTVKTIDKTPEVTLKASGQIDLSFPEKTAVVTANFKNYSGQIGSYTWSVAEMKGKTLLDANAAEKFQIVQNGNTFELRAKDGVTLDTKNSYMLTLKLTLADGSELPEKTVKLAVKNTSVKLKLSKSKVTLNKLVSDAASVTVTCTTKGYPFGEPLWQVTDSKGAAAPDALNVRCEKGILTVSLGEGAVYGGSYKVLLKANAYASPVTLTVSVPTEAKSQITATLKATGTLDVIRDGSTITVMPTYKNVTDCAEMEEQLLIYSAGENVSHLFDIRRNESGAFVITKAEGAALDHTRTYKLQLVTTFNGTVTVESKQVNLKVKMGSAKLEAKAEEATLFGKDKYDRMDFTLVSRDGTLNGIQSLTVKDAKYQDVFEVYSYGNGQFAIGFKNGTVDSKLIGKTVTLTLNAKLEGNETTKVNGAVKLKFTITK